MTPDTSRTCDALIASLIAQTARLSQVTASMRPEPVWVPWVLMGLAIGLGAALGLAVH